MAAPLVFAIRRRRRVLLHEIVALCARIQADALKLYTTPLITPADVAIHVVPLKADAIASLALKVPKSP